MRARAMAAMVVTLGSLNSSTPPPFTWQSIARHQQVAGEIYHSFGADGFACAGQRFDAHPHQRRQPDWMPASVGSLPLRKACSIRRSRSPFEMRRPVRIEARRGSGYWRAVKTWICRIGSMTGCATMVGRMVASRAFAPASSTAPTA